MEINQANINEFYKLVQRSNNQNNPREEIDINITFKEYNDKFRLSYIF